jgi:cation:H+ antiporter
MDYLLLLLGFIVLIGSGEVLVRGAAGIALKFNIPPLVVGLTVVSLGTSAPELLASLQAVWKGAPDICIGNVVGSNIANLGLVLGVTGLFFPVVIARKVMRLDWPVMMLTTGLFAFVMWDLMITFWEGFMLVTALASYMGFLVWNSRRNRDKEPAEIGEVAAKPYWALTALLLVGCVGLYFGAEWLLEGALGIARSFGVSEHVIGVTIIAFGTSIPELATSVAAAIKKQMDISIGNLIGSNIFNILGVIGVTSMVEPIGVAPVVMSEDIYWVAGIAAVLLPMFLISRKIGRIKSLVLLGAYIAYLFSVVA